MVMIYEYRIPLPFTLEEYEIAQLYMVAKFSASESSGDSGDGVEILKNEPFEEEGRKGQYTHKIYHLASKLPSWMVNLLPKNALILEEEAWNAYPHCTTVLKCPFLNKFSVILETNHVADRGLSENALGMDQKTLKKRQVEYIDIAMDQVENYIREEDPAVFKSQKTGRGPLTEGWTTRCEPVMCAYKSVTVDVPYWGFGSRIEKFIAKNAQRNILLEGHRKCFTWLDEWHGLTMQDVRRMEEETAEAIRRARAKALRKLDTGEESGDETAASTTAAGAEDNGKEDGISDGEDTYATSGPLQPFHDDVEKSLNRSNNSTSSNRSHRQTSLKRKSASASSSVGPSFSRGISTISATEKDAGVAECLQSGRLSISSAPPRPVPSPTPTQWHSALKAGDENLKPSTADEVGNLVRNDSSESFGIRSQLNNLSWELREYSIVSSDSDRGRNASDSHDHPTNGSDVAVAKSVDVLDRAIGLAKTLTKHKREGSLTLLGFRNGSTARKSEIIPPINEVAGSNGLVKGNPPDDLDRCVNVLDKVLADFRRRPRGSKQNSKS